jgi:hypothetical protein
MESKRETSNSKPPGPILLSWTPCGASGTWFVPLPLCDPLWALSFWLGLGSSLFVLKFSPFARCFV